MTDDIKQKTVKKKIIIDINFTKKELEEWANAGLISPNLLSPEKHKELVEFVSANRQPLFEHFREDRADLEKFPHSVSLPHPNDMGKTFELPIIERKTGKVVETLELMAKVELFDGLNLHVKAKELDEWLSITERLRFLNKDQAQLFLSKISTDSKNVFSKENIISLVEEIRKKKKSGKVRHAGHFTDAKLQNSVEPLSPATNTKIEQSNVKVKTYGIKLTPAEDKMMNAIYKLLHDKSENNDTNSERFYAGNAVIQLVTYGNDNKKFPSATLRIKPAELYKEYLGKDKYSGKDISNINSTLHGLCEKKFLIQYDRQREVKKNQKNTEIIYDRIEDFQSLIHVMNYFEGMSENDVKRLDKGDKIIREQKGELYIALNPFLTDQIKSKYVLYPPDIIKRTIIASGGALRVTESIIDLRDYLLREISGKRYKPQMNEETLINQIRLSTYAKSGRRKLVNQRINESIEACKKLGIIIDEKIVLGAQGQKKYIFTLDPDFE